MTDPDVCFGLSLSAQSNWNQTELDWRRCLALQPDGCFVAHLDDLPAGTATTCIFGRVAWVAMVLVDERFRRQGIGRALMEHALGFLDKQGIDSVRLDATPLGQPLYEQLGFLPQFSLDRYQGTPTGFEQADPRIITIPPENWLELAAVDSAITRTDRRRLLHRLFAEQPGEVLGIEESGCFRGFLTVRRGNRSTQLGPCVGELGLLLLRDACRRYAGHPVYLDSPTTNESVRQLAARHGLTVQRTFLRMSRGEPVIEQLDLMCSSSGPEKG